MDKTKNKLFDSLMEKASDEIANTQYDRALQTILELENILNGDKEQSIEAWSWIYDYKRYALFELGRIDEAVTQCHDTIGKLQSGKLFPYLREHNQPRAALRAAHNLIAWQLFESATTEQDALVALDHIHKCLEIKSPVEGDEVLDQFRETHALILYKLLQLEPQSKYYKGELFRVLKVPVQQQVVWMQQNPPLTKIAESAEFQEFLDNDPLMSLRKSPPAESALAAMQRYEKAISLLSEINEDVAEFAKLEIRILSDADIAMEEKAFSLPLPGDLKEFCKRHGAFTTGTLDESMTLLPDYLGTDPATRGLACGIDAVWGGRPEFQECYSVDQLEQLNSQFFLFGMRYVDDDTHVYYFFDRDGKFGAVPFNQDDFYHTKKHSFDPMLKGRKLDMTFDQLISEQVSETIASLLEQYAV